MWGSAVNVAYQVQSGSPQPGIYVTSRVYDVMRDTRDFGAAGEVGGGKRHGADLAKFDGARAVTGVLDAPWFYWAVGVAVGFPIALVVLTELQNALRRRNSFLVGRFMCSAPISFRLAPFCFSWSAPSRFPARRRRCASCRRCSSSSCWSCCSPG